jgi:hypothetical protein
MCHGKRSRHNIAFSVLRNLCMSSGDIVQRRHPGKQLSRAAGTRKGVTTRRTATNVFATTVVGFGRRRVFVAPCFDWGRQSRAARSDCGDTISDEKVGVAVAGAIVESAGHTACMSTHNLSCRAFIQLQSLVCSGGFCLNKYDTHTL